MKTYQQRLGTTSGVKTKDDRIDPRMFRRPSKRPTKRGLLGLPPKQESAAPTFAMPLLPRLQRIPSRPTPAATPYPDHQAYAAWSLPELLTHLTRDHHRTLGVPSFLTLIEVVRVHRVLHEAGIR